MVKHFTTRKRPKEAKRPNLKIVSLSPEALALWNGGKHVHDWSSEVSAFIVGKYGSNAPLETRIVYTEDLLKGYQMLYSRSYQKLKAEGEGLLKDLQEQLERFKEELRQKQQMVPLAHRKSQDPEVLDE